MPKSKKSPPSSQNNSDIDDIRLQVSTEEEDISSVEIVKPCKFLKLSKYEKLSIFLAAIAVPKSLVVEDPVDIPSEKSADAGKVTVSKRKFQSFSHNIMQFINCFSKSS